MRWQNRRRSDNIEDRRGASPSRLAIGGGVGTLAVVVIALLFGVDPTTILQQLQGTQVSVPSESGVIDPAQQELADFVSVILADTEDVWRQIFESSGATYERPHLVLFSGGIESACGMASAAMGPFYCPGDAKVYIDLSFYEDLQNRFHAPGDFAQAYVIAHEIGHHVQNQLGVMERVNAARGRVSESEYNEISVRLELQADFLAGVWAHHARKSRDFLEDGDIDEALRAASAIGDDRLQKQSQGYIVPDSFTHGTSEQRVRWFRRGLETGDVTQGDTFMANTL